MEEAIRCTGYVKVAVTAPMPQARQNNVHFAARNAASGMSRATDRNVAGNAM